MFKLIHDLCLGEVSLSSSDLPLLVKHVEFNEKEEEGEGKEEEEEVGKGKCYNVNLGTDVPPPPKKARNLPLLLLPWEEGLFLMGHSV